MKTLKMFLVLSTLTIAACSGNVPDANNDGEEPSATATPQSGAAAESDSIPRDISTIAVPASEGPQTQPNVVSGGAGGGAGTPSSTHRHDLQ